MVNKKRLVAITLAILMLVIECVSLFSCGTKIENFELSFNVDGENYATITTTGTEPIQIPENPSKDGYTFDGWYWDKDVWSKPFTANSLLDAPISSDMSVYAKFTPIAYSISYEMDGGTHNNPATYIIESNFEFADAQKAGYTFLGWYTDATYTTQIKSISAGTTGDMTLYAKFELATYSIAYENTKGAENTNPSTYTINSETITFAPLSKDGYTFGGWYVGDTKVMEISKGSTGNLTLTARWDTIGYSITYHNVDGATHTNPAFYDVEDQPLTLSVASKTGYRFVGWYTDEALTNMVTEIAIGTTGDLELWAKWEAIEYTATFMDGNTVVAEIPFTVETESITAPDVPTHAGYTGVWEDYTLGTEDITVNAVYTLIPYGITYHNVSGATNSNPATYDVEDEPLVLADAQKNYYNFLGWYSDENFTNKVTEIAVGTTGPVELWAKWEAIEYTATFMDGNTVVAEIPFTVETESITAPDVPTHAGYTGVWESYTLGHEDITINAIYTPITYTITYNNTKGVAHSNPTRYNIESATIILTNISAKGYEFDGWFDANGNQVTEISNGSIGDIVLYARWTAIKYNITYMYDADIGDYADENKNPAYYTIEDDFDFIALVNKTQGYTFNGWFTEKNNGTGEQVLGIELGSTGDITVYAQWGLKDYTVTYHNVNGVTNTNPESYNVETETFTIEDVSKIGYSFDGWFSDEALTIPADTTIEKGSYGDLNFYAKWTLVGYSITYVLYGETTDDTTNPDGYTIEDAFTLKAPSRDGYIFVGWYTLAENGTRVTEIKANTTGNQTLYARWIKFESNGGSAVSYTPVHSGNTISAPDAPTRAHYEFNGWYTNEELTQKYNFKPTKSITLYAKWTPVKYEIEYILNGGTNSSGNPDTYTVEDKIELCAPNKVGYTFIGWFTDPEFTSTVVTEIKAGTSGKITLYAHYLINQYTISFESNGGTTVSAITQNYATDVTAPESPAKNGYEFAGWYSDAALKKAYTFTTMPAENITLYAKWNIVTYKIKYNLDGGTNHRNNPSTYKITSADIILETPTKTGYTFDGWYTDSACTQSITKIANGSFGDVELFVKWTATVYNVTYNMPSGATQSNAATYTIETDLITLTNATLKGHTFNGWYSDSTYTTPVTTIAGGAIDDLVLYAKFTANTYNVWLEGDEEAKHTVSFDLNGAEGTVASQTVTPTATLKYPTNPTRNEYIFAGWYNNAACTGAPYDFTAVVTKDTTLYAKWVKIENASLITINGNANATLNGKTEQMLMFVPLVSGNITITSSGEYDTFGTLYNAEMVALVDNEDGAADGKNFHIVYNVTAGETYYIGARAFSSTTTGTATVSISGNTTMLDGGYAITTSQTVVTYGEQFTLTLPEARDGYKFLGYADENGVMYTDANGNSIKNWDKDEDTILYSVWEIAVYTVTLKTDASTVFAEIELPYGVRLDLSQYKPTIAGRVFVGWMYEGAAYNATTMPDYDIILTAQFINYTLSLKLDEVKTAISVNDAVNGKLPASLFNASAVENVTGGTVPMEFECTVSGTIAAGETITVIIQNTENELRRKITGIKVYGMPTLTFDDTVDYFNINGGLTASHFGASGTDTFGASTEIKVYVDGDYKAGDLVKIVIESIDPAGNITCGYIENVKAYGLPEITYNENKTAISVNDTLNAELFGATAKDSFGESLTVTVTRYSGTIASGRTVIIRISSKDSKGNVTNIDVQCKVYGAPTISEATKTDVRADDIVTPELLGITGTDTYGESLTVILSTKDGTQTAGTVWTVTATVIDAAGNVTTKDFELKVYGTPTISYDREGVKVTEDATIDSYTVSFDLNGGSGTIASQTITNTIGLIYPEIPTRSGYAFTGWYTTAGCTTLFDFSANVARNITVYAGWYQITTSGYGNYVMNVIGDNNSSSDYYSISMQGTSSSNAKYTYFTVLKDGTYKLYYKNGSSSTSYRTYMYVYNATQGAEIKSNAYISSTSYSYVSFTAKAGDVIYVRNYRYSTGSSSYYSTFYMYVTGVGTPTAGGMSGAIGASGVLNAIATDSFGNPLTVTAKLSENCTFAAGNYVTYELTATDRLGNSYTLTTAPIGVYDVNDIVFTYSPTLSTIIKETSKGEEFNASATDSFGNACDITIEAAEGYTLEGGKTVSLYIIATDKAGNRVVGTLNSNGDPIPNIKVYGMPNVTLDQDNRVITEATDATFLFTVYDSFGEELWLDAAVSGEQVAGNTIVVTVTATDAAGNIITKQYTFGVLSSEKPFVELYIDGELWQMLFVEDANDYTLPMPDLSDGFEAGWIDKDSNIYSQADGIGLIELPESIQLYCYIYRSGYTPIYTAQQLKAISLSNSTVKYCLAIDLDLNGSEWTPIGTRSSPFTGEFDGNGHVISNFKVTGSVEYAGLFGYNSGVIKNLGVESFTIDVDVSSSSSSSSSYSYAGGLVGCNASGTITNCYATGDVSSSSSYSYAGGLVGCNGSGTITNCYATGSVTSSVSDSSYAGGLVGRNDGTITNSYAKGFVTSSSSSSSSFYDSYAGGLVGDNRSGRIANCYATGSVTSDDGAGGLAGYNGGTIANCYATGSVTSSSNAGGLVGRNYGTITNCYATGDVTSGSAGGLVAYNYGYGTITNCYATGDVSSSSAAGLVAYNYGTITNCYRYSGQSFTVTKNGTTTYEATNTIGTATSIENLQSKEWVEENLWTVEIDVWSFGSGYPKLDYHNINNVVKEISTKEDLLKLQGNALTLHYLLLADIDLGGNEWTPIDGFYGTFDGNGHVISNFKVTGSVGYAGLFGYNSGVIKNLGVESFTIDVDVSSSSSDSYAGGLVGYNDYGTITNSYATGSVTGSSTSSSTSYSYAGGLVGYNDRGTITNSYATGSVTGSSISSSDRFSESYAGGLVGYNNYGTITNCYATGDVTSGSSSGSSSSYSYAGGLVGYNDYGTITNSFATGDVTSSSSSGSSYAGGLVGYNSEGTITNSYATGSVISSSTSTGANYSYAGGLVGRNSGTITNCYATGSVISSSTYTGSGYSYNYSYAGDLVGENRGTITNCYRFSGQSFTVTSNGTTTYQATNTLGTAKAMSELRSVTFQTTTLGWSADDWNFVEGTHPTLKNVGITN